MQVLSTSNHEIKIIPRSYVSSISATIRNEHTQEESTGTLAATTQGNYLIVDLGTLTTYQEGQEFYFTLKDGSDDIYRDRIFITDQSSETYKVQQGDYTSPAADNEFILNG